MTIDQLTKALKEAAEAHHVFEKGLGKPDAEWHVWYAAFIINKYGPLARAVEGN